MNQSLENKVIERTLELNQANQELLRSSQRFFTIFDNNSVGMLMTNLETTRFEFVNETFLSYFSYAKDEVIGKTSIELNLIEPELASPMSL